MEFEIEPEELLGALRVYAINKGLDDKYLRTNAICLSRQINLISDDLRHAGLVVDDIGKEHKDTYASRKLASFSNHISALDAIYIELNILYLYSKIDVHTDGSIIIMPISKPLAKGIGVLYFADCTSSHEASLHSLPFEIRIR
jgi:hypothetical protein